MDAFIAENWEEVGMILTGVYECWDCSKRYKMNVPNTWAPCSATLCHDCYPKPRTFNHPVIYQS